MEAFDVVGLVETWMQEDEWKEGENLLPKVFKWKKQWAKREKERGRASGGILMGVRDSINEVTRANREGREGALGTIIKSGQVELDIWCIYINGNMNEILGWIAETTGGANGDRKVIIGGDWNARTGIMGNPYIDEWGDQVVRESKDKVVNLGGLTPNA
ncbi:hypothetical protein QE152_g7850 [Popillia japonica]|uniref:Endonuclease/exonuclease/phosphatase domain-containing protein n=1 Tax=Popillia japonica TaxID=7064 RepID=A0AAW1ME16_POPJA